MQGFLSWEAVSLAAQCLSLSFGWACSAKKVLSCVTLSERVLMRRKMVSHVTNTHCYIRPPLGAVPQAGMNRGASVSDGVSD